MLYFTEVRGGDAMSRKCAVVVCICLLAQGAAMDAALRFSVHRGQNPWDAYTGSYEAEQASLTVAAAAIEAAFERIEYLSAYVIDNEPLLAIDRAQDRVVVNERFFSSLYRPDVTRIADGARVEIGTVLDARLIETPRRLFSFLIESSLIRTYVHMEASLVLEEMLHTAGEVIACFSGSHVYYTNTRNEEPLAFCIHLDKSTGKIAVIGGSRAAKP